MKHKILQVVFWGFTFILFNKISNGQELPKAEFKPTGKIFGQVFGDFQYKLTAPDSSNLRTYGSKAQYAFVNGYNDKYYSFDLRRVYLGYSYYFSEKFEAQVIFSHEGNLDASGQRTLNIKAANIRWKNIFKGTDLIFGQQGTPIFTTNSEMVWGYRSVEKTITDMRGIASSNDFGISLRGKYFDGNTGFNLMIGNNNATKPENDTYKKFYEDVWVKLLNQKLLLDLNTDYEITSLTPNGPNYKHSLKSKMTIKGCVAYQNKKFSTGIEVFSATWRNYAYTKDTAITNPKPNDTLNVKPFGTSVFVRANIVTKVINNKEISMLSVFGRYDLFNPDLKFSSAVKYTNGSINGHVKETFIVFGLDYMPIEDFHIIPNVWVNNYKENASTTDTNGNKLIGMQKSGSDIDVRLTLFWKF